jgi:hypothetical protein
MSCRRFGKVVENVRTWNENALAAFVANSEVSNDEIAVPPAVVAVACLL